MTRYTPQWLQAGSYAASVDRRLLGALWPSAASSGCLVTAGSGMGLNVAAGQVAVPSQNNTGTTLCSSDATEAVTLPAAPATGTNRIDLIICQPRGNDLDGGSNTDFIFTSVQGTALASPTVPATPAGAVALAQIYVGGGVASIVAGNITDVRPQGLSMPSISGPASGPRGWVASGRGPASTVNVGTTVTLVYQISFPTVTGRRYKLSAYATATGGPTTASTAAQFRARLDGADSQFQPVSSLGITAFFAGSTFTELIGDGATHTWGVASITGPAGATLVFNANYVSLLVEDTGST
jgi:hypothetical protein